MAEEEITFKCLRCGYEYKELYDKKIPKERTCPKCGSNSQRPLPKKEIKKLPQRKKL